LAHLWARPNRAQYTVIYWKVPSLRSKFNTQMSQIGHFYLQKDSLNDTAFWRENFREVFVFVRGNLPEEIVEGILSATFEVSLETVRQVREKI
ncbi:MAG: hypothetical protein ACK4Q5_21525, partial [Saprospiraceae bacterium]